MTIGGGPSNRAQARLESNRNEIKRRVRRCKSSPAYRGRFKKTMKHETQNFPRFTPHPSGYFF
jgi:hypothetical protein